MWRLKEFKQAYTEIITMFPNFSSLLEIFVIALWHALN